jgi:glycosyltransferase involved in cell wall biosynthesis
VQFFARLITCWADLLLKSRSYRPRAVVVGYAGHFDVHLARLCFRGSYVVLDHMTGLAETIEDRGVGGRKWQRLLTRIDMSALGAADLVLVDTDEHAATLRGGVRDLEVVAVGAPDSWHHPSGSSRSSGALRVVFVGLFTPLQGIDTIGRAIMEVVSTTSAEFTLVGQGQDHAIARSIIGDHPQVTWVDWIDADELPGFVAGFDVSLGIFGRSAKALRVVPNKVYQGLAAGTAVITSDTGPQRRLASNPGCGDLRLVPPGDHVALADQLTEMARDPGRLRSERRARRSSPEISSPAAVVSGLSARLTK